MKNLNFALLKHVCPTLCGVPERHPADTVPVILFTLILHTVKGDKHMYQAALNTKQLVDKESFCFPRDELAGCYFNPHRSLHQRSSRLKVWEEAKPGHYYTTNYCLDPEKD